MKKPRLTSENILLIPWIFLFSVILFTGSYRYYVASYHVWTMSFGIVFMTLIFAYDLLVPAPDPHASSSKEDTHDHHCCSDSGCGHSHSKEKPFGFRNFAIHFLPLVLLITNGPQELTVQMADAKDPFVELQSGEDDIGNILSEIKEINPEDYDLSEFKDSDLQKLYTQPAFSKGSYGVIVEGLVYKPSDNEIPSQLQDGTQKTLLLHFVMVCCAADCIPKVVLLHGVQEEDLTENTWVRAWGVATRIGKGTSAEIVLLSVLKHQKLQKPTYPYLFP